MTAPSLTKLSKAIPSTMALRICTISISVRPLSTATIRIMTKKVMIFRKMMLIINILGMRTISPTTLIIMTIGITTLRKMTLSKMKNWQAAK